MSKSIYVGKNTEVPIYEEVTVELEGLNSSTYTTYFSNDKSGRQGCSRHSPATHGQLRFSPNNIGTHSTTGGWILTALHDLKNVKVYCEYCTEKNCDKVTTIINGETVMNAVSGTDNTTLNLIWSGDLDAGKTIDCKYTKDSSVNVTSEKVYWEITCDPLTETIQEIVGYENKDVARKVKKIYSPAIESRPIYDMVETELEGLNSTNYSELYFSPDTYRNDMLLDASTQNGKEGLRFGIDMGKTYSVVVEGVILTALYDLKNVNIYCELYTISNDYAFITVAGTKVLDYASGTRELSLVWSGDLAAGETIDLKFTKNNSTHLSGEKVYWEITCNPAIKKEESIVGYEDVFVAKKVKKAYIGVNGVAKEFFSSGAFGEYTGEYTVSQIEADGIAYNLYTLTKSGTLTLNDNVQFWMCGAGGNGSSAAKYTYQSTDCCHSGAGGGGGYTATGYLESGSYIITIGSGGSTSSVAPSTTIMKDSTVLFETAGGNAAGTYNGGNGGSGGAGCYDYYSSSLHSMGGGTGSGESTYPFGIESLYAHCAGGNCGRCDYINSSGSLGTSSNKMGGSNGSNGTATTGNTSPERGGGTGGTTGTTSAAKGGSATFYGSGGGGGAFYLPNGSTSITGYTSGSYGTGYQGVCYLLVPV